MNLTASSSVKSVMKEIALLAIGSSFWLAGCPQWNSLTWAPDNIARYLQRRNINHLNDLCRLPPLESIPNPTPDPKNVPAEYVTYRDVYLDGYRSGFLQSAYTQGEYKAGCIFSFKPPNDRELAYSAGHTKGYSTGVEMRVRALETKYQLHFEVLDVRSGKICSFNPPGSSAGASR